MAFIRTKEDFTCNNCGNKVVGTGYTNHCQVCLWSRHVDKDPGDRAETCKGMMEPLAVEYVGQEEKILHRCTMCGFIRRNKVQKEDNREELVRIAKRSTQ